MIVIALIIFALYGYLATKRPGLAGLLSVLIIGDILFYGTVYNDFAMMAAGLIALGAMVVYGVICAIKALSKRSPRPIKNQMQTSLAMTVVVIFGWLIVFALLLIMLGWAIGWVTTIFVFLLILLVWVIIRFSVINKRNISITVLGAISAAIRQNLPLAEAMHAAGERDDVSGIILRNIAHWLAQGYSLSESLRLGYARCPSDALALIELAERVNQVPLALKSIENNQLVQSERLNRFDPITPAYPIILLTTAISIIMGTMMIVIPKFRDIFLEFDIELPASTENMCAVCRWFFYEHFYLPWILAGMLCCCVGIYIYSRCEPRRPKNLSSLSRLGDWIKWRLPISHWYELNRSLLRVTTALRLCLNAGASVDAAIIQAIEADVNHCFRPRLRQWLKLVQHGNNTPTAARTSQLGAPLAWAFDDKINRGNTPKLLTQLEHMYRNAYNYWTSIARYAVWPLYILALAIMMGVVIYTLFLPLVALIEGTIASCSV